MILGLDTATGILGLALLQEGHVVSRLALEVGRSHSERLPGALDRFLKESGAALPDLSGLAVSIGPGSFTGLRVGLSLAKGLAYARSLPLLGVPTLQALAWRCASVPLSLCPMLDARKGEVFCARFQGGGGRLQAIGPARAIPPDALCAEVREPTVFLGSGARVYRKVLEQGLGERAQFITPNPESPDPGDVAYLGWLRLQAGERDDLAALEPIYLRASDAELKFKP